MPAKKPKKKVKRKKSKKADDNFYDKLSSATGELPAKSPDFFKQLTDKVVEEWGIVKVSEKMLVGRMISTFMKLKKVEELLGTYDICYEERDEVGNIKNVKVNQLAHYLRSLESEFRSYFRTIQQARGGAEEDAIQDLHDLINVTPEKKK